MILGYVFTHLHKVWLTSGEYTEHRQHKRRKAKDDRYQRGRAQHCRELEVSIVLESTTSTIFSQYRYDFGRYEGRRKEEKARETKHQVLLVCETHSKQTYYDFLA